MCFAAHAAGSRSACSEREPDSCGVDDELLVGFGVGGEGVPLERDLADDRIVVPALAASLDGDVGSGPPLRNWASRARAPRLQKSRPRRRVYVGPIRPFASA